MVCLWGREEERPWERGWRKSVCVGAKYKLFNSYHFLSFELFLIDCEELSQEYFGMQQVAANILLAVSHTCTFFASSQVFSLPHLHVITLGMVYDNTACDWQILTVSKSMVTLRNPEVFMLAPCNFELFVLFFQYWIIRIGSSTGNKREFTKSPLSQHFFSSPSQCFTSLNIGQGTNLSLLTVR